MTRMASIGVAALLLVETSARAAFAELIPAAFASTGADRSAIKALLATHTTAVSTKNQALFESLLLDTAIPFSGVGAADGSCGAKVVITNYDSVRRKRVWRAPVQPTCSGRSPRPGRAAGVCVAGLRQHRSGWEELGLEDAPAPEGQRSMKDRQRVLHRPFRLRSNDVQAAPGAGRSAAGSRRRQRRPDLAARPQSDRNPCNGDWVLSQTRNTAEIKAAAAERYRIYLQADGRIRWKSPSLHEVVYGRTAGQLMLIRRLRPTILSLAVSAEGPRVLVYHVAHEGKHEGEARLNPIDQGKAWVDISQPAGRFDLAAAVVYVQPDAAVR